MGKRLLSKSGFKDEKVASVVIVANLAFLKYFYLKVLVKVICNEAGKMFQLAYDLRAIFLEIRLNF